MTGNEKLKSRHATYAAAGLAVAIMGSGGVASAATAGQSAAAAAAARPDVNMERVVVQAQVEPWLNRDTKLPGDVSVKRVQKALKAKGYGTTVDGHFGDETRADYARWQRHLGYSGNAANGIPGPTSLKKLGSGRFDVDHKITVGSKVTYKGERMNKRTYNMVRQAYRKVGFTREITKGSYVGCDSNSACTHAAGGALDISVNGLGTKNRWKLVKALRQVGFAAWLRTPGQGFDYHIHAIAVGDTDMHLQAADQVGDYYRGRNGLSGHDKDNTPKKYRATFTWWEQYKR